MHAPVHCAWTCTFTNMTLKGGGDPSYYTGSKAKPLWASFTQSHTSFTFFWFFHFKGDLMLFPFFSLPCFHTKLNRINSWLRPLQTSVPNHGRLWRITPSQMDPETATSACIAGGLSRPHGSARSRGHGPMRYICINRWSFKYLDVMHASHIPPQTTCSHKHIHLIHSFIHPINQPTMINRRTASYVSLSTSMDQRSGCSLPPGWDPAVASNAGSDTLTIWTHTVSIKGGGCLVICHQSIPL